MSWAAFFAFSNLLGCLLCLNPLSALLTYVYMSWQCNPLECSVGIPIYMLWYYLQENLHKICSSKDFLVDFFCLLAGLLGNPVKSKEKILQQYFTLWFISLSVKRQKKQQKLSTGGSSFHLKSALKGLNYRWHLFFHLWWLNANGLTLSSAGLTLMHWVRLEQVCTHIPKFIVHITLHWFLHMCLRYMI